jgi:hypothetical protein
MNLQIIRYGFALGAIGLATSGGWWSELIASVNELSNNSKSDARVVTTSDVASKAHADFRSH